MSPGKYLGLATMLVLGNINKERRVCKLKYGCEETLWYGNREEVCRRRAERLPGDSDIRSADSIGTWKNEVQKDWSLQVRS